MLLLPNLKKSKRARIVNVSSCAHRLAKMINFDNINMRNGAYRPMLAYSQSKQAQISFTKELSKRLGKDSNVNVYSLNPGLIKTDLYRYGSGGESWTLRHRIEPESGAQTTLYCALEESLDSDTGFYYK